MSQEKTSCYNITLSLLQNIALSDDLSSAKEAVGKHAEQAREGSEKMQVMNKRISELEVSADFFGSVVVHVAFAHRSIPPVAVLNMPKNGFVSGSF